jgi:hypothetical protein
VQRRGGLCRDGRIAPSGIGHAGAQTRPVESMAPREVAQRCPWFKVCVDVG